MAILRSHDPNTVKMKNLLTNFYHLIAIKDISMGDEITVKYTFYKIGDNGN